MKFLMDKAKTAIKDKSIFKGLDYDTALEAEFLKPEYQIMHGFDEDGQSLGGAVVKFDGDFIEFHLINFINSKQRALKALDEALTMFPLKAWSENEAMTRLLLSMGFEPEGGAYVRR